MFDIGYLNDLRRFEIESVLPHLPAGCRILDFGSGTGEQARFLADHGFEVVAIDLASSNYAADRLFPIEDYDGRNIPLADHSIDVIFSSNVLEHIKNIEELSDEFRRVLKANGFAIHVLPTAVWRSWTFMSALVDSIVTAAKLPARSLVRRSGERRRMMIAREFRHIASGFVPRAHGVGREGISELWTFSRRAWLRKFERLGFEVDKDWPVGIFYTGSLLFGRALSMGRRRRLGRMLGSVTRAYLVRPREQNS